MPLDSVLSNELLFRWDLPTRRLLVLYADERRSTHPIAEIEYATLDQMSWPEAAKFIGEFVTLLVPELRARYAAEFADANEPPSADDA